MKRAIPRILIQISHAQQSNAMRIFGTLAHFPTNWAFQCVFPPLWVRTCEADYMANFSQANRAEIFWNKFSPSWKFYPGFLNQGRIFSPAKRAWKSEKAQIEYGNIDFKTDKFKPGAIIRETWFKQYETVRKAMKSASLKMYSLSLQIRLSSWEIRSQRQVSLQFHHLVVGCCHSSSKSWKLNSAERPNCDRSNAPVFIIRVLGASPDWSSPLHPLNGFRITFLRDSPSQE